MSENLEAIGSVSDAIEQLIAEIAPEFSMTVFPRNQGWSSICGGIPLARYLRKKYQAGAFDHLTDDELSGCALAIEAVRRAQARGACFDPAFIDGLCSDVNRRLWPERPKVG